MSNNRTFVTVLMATTLLAGGAAFAANQQDHQPAPGAANTPLNTAAKDFGKLSAEGTRANQDIALARVAIFEGRTAQAKTLVNEADAALAKAKGSDAAFVKAHEAAVPDAASKKDSAELGMWLPVDSVISLDEDFSASPVKTKAVAEANEHLRHGDQHAAMEKLKLADVGMSVTQEVLPLQQTISEVHQASSLIDQGKFFEGSQALRKVQMGARFITATYAGGPNGKVTFSEASDLNQTANPKTAANPSATNPSASEPSASGAQAAVSPNGPEPYSAPVPQDPATK